MHGVGLPSSVRVTSTTSRSEATYRPWPSPRTSNRVSSNPAVTSSMRTYAGPAASSATARSIASPTGHRPAITPRPVASAIGGVGATCLSASAQRAACTTWSLALPAPDSVTT